MIWFWVQKWKYTHASMHACMHECMHACMHPCRCARIPWKTRAELDSPGAPSEWQMAICIYIYICVFKYIYKCIHTCIHMYGYTHVYMYIQKYIHVYLRHQILFTCSPAKHPSREGLRLNDWGLKISKSFVFHWIGTPDHQVIFCPLNWDSRSPEGFRLIQKNAWGVPGNPLRATLLDELF